MTTELEREFGRLILHDSVAHPSLGRVHVHVDGAPLDPSDLALMDQSGWRALSQGQGWPQTFMDRLSQLVDDWLRGSDRKELLLLARSPGPNREDFRPAELFQKWLDEERLERLKRSDGGFRRNKTARPLLRLEPCPASGAFSGGPHRDDAVSLSGEHLPLIHTRKHL